MRRVPVAIIAVLALVLGSAASAHHSGEWVKARLNSCEIEAYDATLLHQFEGDYGDAVKIMCAESLGNPRALNDGGEHSVGLFQINTENGRGGWLNGWGYPDSECALGDVDLYDPEVNIESAKKIFDCAGGWEPWTTDWILDVSWE